MAANPVFFNTRLWCGFPGRPDCTPITRVLLRVLGTSTGRTVSFDFGHSSELEVWLVISTPGATHSSVPVRCMVTWDPKALSMSSQCKWNWEGLTRDSSHLCCEVTAHSHHSVQVRLRPQDTLIILLHCQHQASLKAVVSVFEK